ncbi:restriction endonuclease subunit S [Ferrimonas sp. SCSIO 43195]|uniref:restriction endonuclease subunit S n=1 Tax=Ferrimonas sp. SCSIO 43195 TaxID=2822844 RepID=UPI0020762F08|nr:restriction endonuclease subunit S [Ferrimonas sp. SCSIO 43195]USD35988.1 restriction endonuclease subunit S [Ferrimonas sp. SCSIO 43195]
MDAITEKQTVSDSKFQPYPECVDSRVEWLGQVPSHWKLSRVKDIAKVIGGYPFDSKKFDPELGIPLVRIRDINSKTAVVRFNGVVPDEALIDTGDVLVGMDGEFNVAKWRGQSAALNQRVACVRSTSSVRTAFLFYMLPFNMKVVNDLTYYTTVKHLSLEDIAKTLFAMPPEEELMSIIAFLDYETSRIDVLIAKQQRLIELLKEKRQAVISHAVTKGLSPDAPMKDSGVEWLGEIPAHWVVKKSSYLFSQSPKNGISPPVTDSHDGVPTFSISAVRGGKVNILQNLKMVSLDPSTAQQFAVQPGDALVVRGNGNLSMVGAVGLVQEPVPKRCIYPDILIRVKLNEQVILTDFFVNAWSSKPSRSQIENMANTTNGTYKINGEHMRSVYLAVPPLEEQAEIVETVVRASAKIEDLISRAEVAVGLLQERRTALISAAVTGKIDLRGWIAPKEGEYERY